MKTKRLYGDNGHLNKKGRLISSRIDKYFIKLLKEYKDIDTIDFSQIAQLSASYQSCMLVAL